jgi:hypothetical protein
MNKFSIIGDTATKLGFIVEPPGWVDAYVLTANIAKNIPVPEGAGVVLFSANCDFYVSWKGTAEVPASDVKDGTSNELNPSARYTSGKNMFSIISPSAGIVTMAFYAL